MLGYTDQALSTGVEFETDEELAEILDTIKAVKEGELEPDVAAEKVTGEERKKKHLELEEL